MVEAALRTFEEELASARAFSADAGPEGPRLRDLGFSDLYVRLDGESPSRYKATPDGAGQGGNLTLPPAYAEDVAAIRVLVERDGGEEGAFVHDDMRFRFCSAEFAGGEVWAALRRIDMGLPSLDGLGMAPDAVSMVRQWSRRRGLVLVGGAMGAGKTTTAVSVVNDILSRSKEVAVLIEDPPEYLMHGPLGQGMCFQFEVREEADWARKMRIALRWRARVIMVGEIRTPEAAAQVLRISTTGHLVLATAHGGSPGETLASVLRHAEVSLGDAARTMLADHLVGCLHQRLTRQGPEVNAIATPPGADGMDNVRKLISETRFESLGDHVRSFRPAPAG